MSRELFERLLTHGAYTELVASELTRQIASAVYRMHSCGVVHRDLKPENLVLMKNDSDTPHIKLIDFGTAVILVQCGGMSQVMPVECDSPSRISWDAREDWSEILERYVETGRTDFQPISTTSRG